MTTRARARYAGHRFPAEIIGHAVWLYFRFPLGLRMVEELLAARGIIYTHETVRQWVRKFGQQFANQIRRRRAGFAGKFPGQQIAQRTSAPKSSGRGDNDSRRCNPRIRMLILRRDADLENRQHSLDQDAKPVDALPEIVVTKRQVDFDTSRDEHHGPPPSSADTTRRIVSASISRSKRTRRAANQLDLNTGDRPLNNNSGRRRPGRLVQCLRSRRRVIRHFDRHEACRRS